MIRPAASDKHCGQIIRLPGTKLRNVEFSHCNVYCDTTPTIRDGETTKAIGISFLILIATGPDPRILYK